jgi:hypothetical protein
MVQVQRLAEMRPCEAVLMRPCDINRSCSTWIYAPANRLAMDKESGGLQLNLRGCTEQVRNLSPLQGMRLVSLNLGFCSKVQDFSPLRGMPLTRLDLMETGAQDLVFLKDMPLTSLSLHGCHQVRDVMPLKGMRLTSLTLAECEKVQDVTPLHGMPLRSLDLHGCRQVSDLTPLEGLALTEAEIPFGNIKKGKEVIRRMKSLTKINGMPPEEFWKKHDMGELK